MEAFGRAPSCLHLPVDIFTTFLKKAKLECNSLLKNMDADLRFLPIKQIEKAKAARATKDLFVSDQNGSINTAVNHSQVNGEYKDEAEDVRGRVTRLSVGKKYSDEYSAQNGVNGVLQGQEEPEDGRRFMVYICGGYKDSVTERNALREDVYPRLYLYCKQRGCDFRMIDLRCGVRNPISDHHDTVALHLDCLKKCRETQRSSFFMFVGQKYEVQSLPSTIEKEDFEAILQLLEKDKELISQKKAVDFTLPPSTAGFTSSAAMSSLQESIYSHYLSFGDEGTEAGQQAETDDEDERQIPVGARGAEDVDAELGLFQMWYKLDTNSIPPLYRLLPISTNHPDALSADEGRQRPAREAWRGTLQRLWRVLHFRAAEAVGKERAARLLRTVLDWEVEEGVQPAGQAPPEEHCHCYKRIIPDLHLNLRNRHAALYVDLLRGQEELDPVYSSEHQNFMDRVHKKLRHTNIYERKVAWGKTGLDPKRNSSHRFYAERICTHALRTLVGAINRVTKSPRKHGTFEKMRREAMRARTQEEIQRHKRHSLHLAKNLTLRQAFLDDVKRSVERSSSGRTLVQGPPGWGKTTVMAAVAHEAPQWLPGNVKVLVVFVGFTGESRNVRLVLQSLCVQLAEIYRPETQLSEGFPQLANEFHSLLTLADADRPVVILLDGLDELSEEHGPRLSWILTPLPRNVHLVLSASTHSPCTEILSGHSTVLSLPSLGVSDITAALESKLRRDQRRLRQDQWQLLVQACETCPCPLYLETAYSESSRWTSYADQACAELPGTLQGVYGSMLSRVERDTGPQLVRRAAMLLSISRHGATEEEILHLLSKDGKVLQELSSVPRVSASPFKFPYILWARVKHALGRHLSEVRTDGTWVYRWAHSELRRVCLQRYFRNEESRMAVHADYADYYRDKSPNAHVFQPTAWVLDEGEDEEVCYSFNLRKLRGLPFHLVHSGQIVPLLSECLFRYEFLLHKAWGLSVLEIEEDLKKAVLPDKDMVDVEVLSGALELSRSVLLLDPCQLPSQLMGRLGKMVMEDRPVALGDPLKFQFLHALLDQCSHSTLPALLPSTTCLLPPGGLHHTLLAGPLCTVTALGGSQTEAAAVTSEADGSIQFWDLEQRRIVRTLDPVEGFVADSLTLSLNDTMLVLRMGPNLQIREVASGRVVFSDAGSVDVPLVTTASNGQYLVVFYDGTPKVKVFDLAASCALLHSFTVSLSSEAIHRNASVVLSRNSVDDRVLFAHRSGSEAGVLSAKDGTVVNVLSARHEAAAIQAVDMTQDYLLLFCRYPYSHDSQIVHIELFSTASFQYERSILGCGQDSVSQVSVNPAGTHAVAFCSTHGTGVTALVTWNLETEDHKHITQFSGRLVKGLCLDLRLCLALCSGERYLRLWDLTPRIADQALTYNIHKTRSDGTRRLVPMGRYAVCLSARPGTVFVWNLGRKRYRCRPVRAFHGLFSPSDVVLAHDLKLYILTNSSVSHRARAPACFQTLLVFDLIRRSYVKRQRGLSVIPCPPHEYHILEKGATLLGLSESRDQFILWDLDSGDIKHRMHLKRESTPSTPILLPWDAPTDSLSANNTRTDEDKLESLCAIDQYLISGDEQVVVCSYFTQHLNVFNISSREHVHTLEDASSLLNLHTAALTHTGSHLVLTCYNQDRRSPSVTLWDLQRGTVEKELQQEPGVCCVALTDDARRVVFGVTGGNKLKVWEPFSGNMKIISGYEDLRIEASSAVYTTEGGAKALLLSGHLSLWDVEKGRFLSSLSLDSAVSCARPAGGSVSKVLLGLSHSPALVTVWDSAGGSSATQRGSRAADVFEESSSSEEDNS